MTNEEWIALGRRAVACKGWRWEPGMLCAWESVRVEEGGRVGDRLYIIGHGSNGHVDRVADSRFDIPGLSDPATLGCLLSLVRGAWGDAMLSPSVFAVNKQGAAVEWTVMGVERGGAFTVYGATEAEALVAALEKAP